MFETKPIKLPAHQWRGPNGFRLWQSEYGYHEYQLEPFRGYYLGDKVAVQLKDDRRLVLTHPFLRGTLERLFEIYQREVGWSQVNGYEHPQPLWIPQGLKERPWGMSYAHDVGDRDTEVILAAFWKEIDGIHHTHQDHLKKNWWRLFAWHHLDTVLTTCCWAPETGKNAVGNFYLTYFHIWQFNEVCNAREDYKPRSQPGSPERLKKLFPHVAAGVGNWPWHLRETAVPEVEISQFIPEGSTPEMCGLDPRGLAQFINEEYRDKP